MCKGRILVIEDDNDVAKMWRIYFDTLGYEVTIANQGYDAIYICRTKLPHVITLDIYLSDLDGYEVFLNLRNHTRTRHIPVVLFTNYLYDVRSELLSDLDHYFTPPYSPSDVKNRIENILRATSDKAFTHPITNLPSGKLIEEQLKIAKKVPEQCALLYCNLSRDRSNSLPFNETLIFLADTMNETVETYGSPNDFVGHPSNGDFVVLTRPQSASTIRDVITQRFNEQMGQSASLSWRQVNL